MRVEQMRKRWQRAFHGLTVECLWLFFLLMALRCCLFLAWRMLGRLLLLVGGVCARLILARERLAFKRTLDSCLRLL